MNNTARSLIASALLIAASSAAHAELISLNGYTGSNTIASTNDNIASWSLSRAVNDTAIFLSATFTVGAGTSIDGGDFFAVWANNKDGLGFGIRGQDSNNPVSDVFARPQYSALSELAANQVGSVNLSAGSSFSMLVSFYKTGGTTASVYDGVRVWLNPTAADTASSWDYSFTRSASNSLASITSLGLRGANLDAGDSVTVSNLALGTTFADVSPVPEASTLSMLLAGLGMVGFIARRRMKA